MAWKGEHKRHRIAALKRKRRTAYDIYKTKITPEQKAIYFKKQKKKALRYRTRYVRKGYYQKLAFHRKKVVAISGYKSGPGKDKKLYERVFK